MGKKCSAGSWLSLERFIKVQCAKAWTSKITPFEVITYSAVKKLQQIFLNAALE